MPERRYPKRQCRSTQEVKYEPNKVTGDDGQPLPQGSVVLVIPSGQRSTYVTVPVGTKDGHAILAICWQPPYDDSAVSNHRDCLFILPAHIKRCLPLADNEPWCYVVSPEGDRDSVTTEQIRDALNDVWGVKTSLKETHNQHFVKWNEGPKLWVHPLADPVEEISGDRLQCGLFADTESPIIEAGTGLLPMSGTLTTCSEDRVMQRYELQTSDVHVVANLYNMPAGYANFAWDPSPECNAKYDEKRACLVASRNVKPGEEIRYYYGCAPGLPKMHVPKHDLNQQRALLAKHDAKLTGKRKRVT